MTLDNAASDAGHSAPPSKSSIDLQVSMSNAATTDAAATGSALLDDVVVVEVGTSEATAWCGRVLSDLGARVLRLGSIDDDVDGDRRYAKFLHAGKLLIQSEPVADVVLVDGGRDDAVVQKLKQLNPRTVVVSVSDYGLTGPAASWPASELTLQAEAGIVAIHPTSNRPPVAMGVNLAEQVSGRWAAVGAVSGLLAVRSGAAGTDVDVSRFESLVSVLQYPWLMAQLPHNFPYPVPQMAVPGIEAAKDGWVCVVAVSPQQWSAFKELATDARLDDPRFDQFVERIRLAEEVRPLIREFTQRHDVDELVTMGAARRLPIVPVTTPASAGGFAPFAQRGSIVSDRSGRHAHPRSPSRVQTDSSDPRPVVSRPALATPERPLRGVRVLEIASYQAGPLVGANLAALGADVVRVESIGKPDALRLMSAPPTANRFWELASAFAGVNVGKRSFTADLSEPRGREAIDKLIAVSDVLIENYVPRVLDDRGLDYAAVRALRPNIVMTRMPAWGLSGQWRDRPGFTFTANATSGLSWMTGYPDDDPLLTGTVVDPIAAIVATASTLAAIYRQQRLGQGALVEVPLCDVALELSAPHIVAAADGEQPIRSGNRRKGLAPQGIYRSADGQWVAISITSDTQWRALSDLPGMPDLVADRSLDGVDERIQRHDELDHMLAKMSAQISAEDLVLNLRKIGVPAARVQIGTELIDHPQLIARERVFTLDHPVAGQARYIGLPVRFSHDPVASADRAAPLFGEHSREILTEIGFAAEEIDALDAQGMLSATPYGLPYDRSR